MNFGKRAVVSGPDIHQVRETMCRVIAKAERWMTVQMALDALFHAELLWKPLEEEARWATPETTEAQSQ